MEQLVSIGSGRNSRDEQGEAMRIAARAHREQEEQEEQGVAQGATERSRKEQAGAVLTDCSTLH